MACAGGHRPYLDVPEHGGSDDAKDRTALHAFRRNAIHGGEGTEDSASFALDGHGGRDGDLDVAEHGSDEQLGNTGWKRMLAQVELDVAEDGDDTRSAFEREVAAALDVRKYRDGAARALGLHDREGRRRGRHGERALDDRQLCPGLEWSEIFDEREKLRGRRPRICRVHAFFEFVETNLVLRKRVG